MKLIASLDRASDTRMRTAARPRLAMLAIIGFALVAPLLSGSAIAAATGTDKPATMIASAGLLGGLALTGPLREEDKDLPGGGSKVKGTIGEKLAAAEAKVGTLGERITSLEGELATAKGAADTATAEIERLKAALAEKETALATANEDLTKAKEGQTKAEAEVAKLTAEKKTVDERAQELVASLGFPSTKLPAADDKGDANDLPSSQAELEAALAKLPTHKEKSALIRRYEAARAGATA